MLEWLWVDFDDRILKSLKPVLKLSVFKDVRGKTRFSENSWVEQTA